MRSDFGKNLGILSLDGNVPVGKQRNFYFNINKAALH